METTIYNSAICWILLGKIDIGGEAMETRGALEAAKAMAAEVQTEAGRTPLERVLTKNWAIIDSWRQAGWTWRQIASLFNRAGIFLKSGKPVTENYLSAVSSRVERAARPVPQQSAGQSLPIKQSRENVDGSIQFQSRHSSENNNIPNIEFEEKLSNIDEAIESKTRNIYDVRRSMIQERMKRATKARS